VGGTERLVLFPTWLLLDLLGVVMLSTFGYEHTARKYTDFLISEYVISNDSELSFDNINILNLFIHIKQTQIPVTLILIIFTFIYLNIMIIIKYRKY